MAAVEHRSEPETAPEGAPAVAPEPGEQKIQKRIRKTRRCRDAAKMMSIVIRGPVSRKEATTGPRKAEWKKSDMGEISKMKKRPLWREPTDDERRKVRKGMLKPNRCHIVRVIKRCGRLKSRLVADGSKSEYSKGETYAPTPLPTTAKSALTYGAQHQWHHRNGDVTQAYLNAKLDPAEPIILPEEVLEDGEDGLKMAIVAIYGRKPSGRDWNRKELHPQLLAWGWTNIPNDGAAYCKFDQMGQPIAFLIVYTDDFLVVARDKDEADSTIAAIVKRWDATLGKVAITENAGGNADHKLDFCGIDVIHTYDRAGRIVRLRFCGRARVAKILEKYGGSAIRARNLPASHKHREEWRALRNKDPDRAKGTKVAEQNDDLWEREYARVTDPAEGEDSESEGDPVCDSVKSVPKWSNRAVLGDILFLAMTTRVDVVEATLAASRCPCESLQRSMIIFLLGYLKKHPSRCTEWSSNSWSNFKRAYGALFTSGVPPFVCFSDASFASCPQSNRSISGTTLVLYGTTVGWRSKRQSCTVLSTPHAETNAAADSIQFAQGSAVTSIMVRPSPIFGDHAPCPTVLIDNSPLLDQSQCAFNTSASRLTRHVSRLCQNSPRVCVSALLGWWLATVSQNHALKG